MGSTPSTVKDFRVGPILANKDGYVDRNLHIKQDIASLASIYGKTQVVGITAADQVTATSDTTTTTDATVTEVLNLALSEDEAVMVKATVMGREGGGAGNHYAGEIIGLFKREAAGNVTLIGATVPTFTAINVDAWGGVTLTADAANQTVDVNVTGKAATNISWQVKIEYLVVSV